MNEKIDIPVWEKYTLTIEEASRYFTIGQNKLRRLVEEKNRHGDWYVMNGNRILIKKKQFEKFMDKTDAI
ncbi:MAG: excisionase [Faecalibacillus intestinalis]|uniref:excisionase n=1 Tax=Faecalibacillus intestinalis TaxID=1982626 RepID=UPI0039A15FC0